MGVQLLIDREPLVIKIPMKPFLVKFLHQKFGDYHKVSKTTWLGISATNLLTHVYSKPQHVRTNSNFTILIPYTICQKKGHFINYDAIPEFKQNAERIFRDFMHEYITINAKGNEHGEVMHSLKKFLKHYNISEDEVRLESAYRHYMRTLEETSNKTEKKLNKKTSV